MDSKHNAERGQAEQCSIAIIWTVEQCRYKAGKRIERSRCGRQRARSGSAERDQGNKRHDETSFAKIFSRSPLGKINSKRPAARIGSGTTDSVSSHVTAYKPKVCMQYCGHT